jgi:hypothetical protein
VLTSAPDSYNRTMTKGLLSLIHKYRNDSLTQYESLGTGTKVWAAFALAH